MAGEGYTPWGGRGGGTFALSGGRGGLGELSFWQVREVVKERRRLLRPLTAIVRVSDGRCWPSAQWPAQRRMNEVFDDGDDLLTVEVGESVGVKIQRARALRAAAAGQGRQGKGAAAAGAAKAGRTAGNSGKGKPMAAARFAILGGGGGVAGSVVGGRKPKTIRLDGTTDMAALLWKLTGAKGARPGPSLGRPKRAEQAARSPPGGKKAEPGVSVNSWNVSPDSTLRTSPGAGEPADEISVGRGPTSLVQAALS